MHTSSPLVCQRGQKACSGCRRMQSCLIRNTKGLPAVGRGGGGGGGGAKHTAETKGRRQPARDTQTKQGP